MGHDQPARTARLTHGLTSKWVRTIGTYEVTTPDAALRILAADVGDAGQHVLVVLAGTLTWPTGATLRDRLAALLTAGRSRFVVDLRRLDLLDPVGLAVLDAASRAHQDGCLHVVADADDDPAGPAVRGTGLLHRLLPPAASVEAAVRACRASAGAAEPGWGIGTR